MSTIEEIAQESNVSVEIVEDLHGRVQAGAELLDRKLPGWFKAINLRKLSLATPAPDADLNLFTLAEKGYGCVLCQLDNYIASDERLPRSPISVRNFGDFTEAYRKLDIDPGLFGFDIEEDEREYVALDILWTELIEERLANV